MRRTIGPTRLIRPLAMMAGFLAACTPVASSPVPPRPVPDVVVTATAPSQSTTIVLDEAATGPNCPVVFCVIYHIDPTATWSGGAPVTAEDFAHTVSLHQGSADPGGYGHVGSVDVLDEQTALVAFDEPYGAWQSLFQRVFRSGRLSGDISEIDTTGPFEFAEWVEGEHLTVRRDRQWWAEEDPLSGAALGEVGEITFVFMDTVEEMMGALEADEIDVFIARADVPAIERLLAADDLEHEVAPGPFWEHIDFNHEDPLLSESWVREAISRAIDREKILDRTVRLVDPDASTLDNTVWMASSPHYEAHFEDRPDPERAEQILADNGCARGEDGVQVCGGLRMSFTWVSTADDPARREIFESVREDLEVVGVEMVGEFRSPSAFVTREFLFGGPEAWQMVDFSWRSQPDPVASSSTYYCQGALNVNRYCSEEVERIVVAAETIVDPERRAAAYNRADRAYLRDRAVIPLYQRPTLMAWASAIDGPEPNHSPSSDVWNIASWSGRESIVVALTSEPASIDPLSTADDNANLILSTLLYGAYGMSPSFEKSPVLVESVEVLEGG